MSKRPRSLSPSQVSTSSQRHKGKQRAYDVFSPSSRPHTLDGLLERQEIFLRILSFLSPTELALVQGVSRYWAHMSLDPQLWKRLYLSRYPHPHHSKLLYRDRNLSGSSTPSSRRPISRIPSRAFPPPSPTRSSSVSSTAQHAPVPSPTAARGILSGTGFAKPLTPGSGRQSDEIGYGVRNDGVDWKMMLRLGANWANGNVLSETTIPLPPSPSPSLSSTFDPVSDLDLRARSSTKLDGTAPYSEQHIALFPSFIFTSAPDSPLVHVYRSRPADPTSGSPPVALGIIPPPPGWSSPNRPDNVTAISADQSVIEHDAEPLDMSGGRPALPARLAVFYQSGGFVVLRVRHDQSSAARGGLAWTRENVHSSRSRPRTLRQRATAYLPLDGDPIVLAALHYPVLLACSVSFHLSVYLLSSPESDNQPTEPRHLQTLRSDTSFHPAALTLLPVDVGPEEEMPSVGRQSASFRAALTYSTPLYPSSWTIAVQEFGIDLGSSPPNLLGIQGEVWRGDCYHVGRGDESDHCTNLAWPKRIKSIVGVRGRRAVGVGTDGRWCVLAGDDNQIQVYSLPMPSPAPIRSASGGLEGGTPINTGLILHSQTLLAHSAAVTSISLAAGRCVSGGRDGRVLVWELDEQDSDSDPDLGDGESRFEGRLGRTVGYVEVKPGGRRQVWRGPSGPVEDLDEANGNDESAHTSTTGWYRRHEGLPHPASISAAARSLFLPRPPEMPFARSETKNDRPPVIRQLAFDEEKIVGLIRDERKLGRGGVSGGEMMKVWSFNI